MNPTPHRNSNDASWDRGTINKKRVGAEFKNFFLFMVGIIGTVICAIAAFFVYNEGVVFLSSTLFGGPWPGFDAALILTGIIPFGFLAWHQIRDVTD